MNRENTKYITKEKQSTESLVPLRPYTSVIKPQSDSFLGNIQLQSCRPNNQQAHKIIAVV